MILHTRIKEPRVRIRSILQIVGWLGVGVTALCSNTPANAATQETMWNTSYNLMHLMQTGSTVTGVYIYDDGVLYGTMVGRDFQGWWREAGNSKGCGPDNGWSGPVVFRFNHDTIATSQSFIGDWGYCGETIENLDPDLQTWNGTRRDGSDTYTESECQAAGWHWCDSTCQIQACGTEITREECENASWTWCNGTCSVAVCPKVDLTPIRFFLLGE